MYRRMFSSLFIVALLLMLGLPTTAQVKNQNSNTDTQTAPELPGHGGDRTATFDPYDAYFRPA